MNSRASSIPAASLSGVRTQMARKGRRNPTSRKYHGALLQFTSHSTKRCQVIAHHITKIPQTKHLGTHSPTLTARKWEGDAGHQSGRAIRRSCTGTRTLRIASLLWPNLTRMPCRLLGFSPRCQLSKMQNAGSSLC